MNITRSAVLVTTAALALSACSAFADDDGGADESDSVAVVTTFSVLADIVENVGGDRVQVHSMVPMGTDPHEYQPLPEDIEKATEADLLLWNGLDMETGDGWFANLVDVAGKSFDGEHVAELAAGVEPMMLTDGDAEEINPHAFLSPDAGLTYTQNVIDALAEIDPDHADEYEANGADFLDRIGQIDTQYAEAFADIPDDERILVTSERAFQYMADDYELSEGYLWEIDTDEQGTPDQIVSLVDFVTDTQPHGLLVETNVDQRAMETVSQETGVPVVSEIYSDELGDEDSPASTYTDYLEYNLEVMLEAMKP